MIRFVRGDLAATDADGVVVAMGGMGIAVRVSDTTRAALPPAGSEVTLRTHLVVREDALDLYGFADDAERALFEALIGVNGVGPRMALAICGLGTPPALAAAIGLVQLEQQRFAAAKSTFENALAKLESFRFAQLLGLVHTFIAVCDISLEAWEAGLGRLKDGAHRLATSGYTDPDLPRLLRGAAERAEVAGRPEITELARAVAADQLRRQGRGE